MTERDLLVIKRLLERTENLPEIVHLRAAPIGYELTIADRELLLDTYQKLDDILKEVLAFIKVKFPRREDYILYWNKIDFDTKIGPLKIITTDSAHIKSAWKTGIFDLKSLIKNLINEVSLRVEEDNDKFNSFFNEKEWEDYLNQRLEKRSDKADFFLDIIIEKGLINLDKFTVRKYFKQWLYDSQDFDLQINDGDFSIEEGDIKIVPDFRKENIAGFLKWFEKEGNNFIDYLKKQGVNVKKSSKEAIINSGNMIINHDSKIDKQTINSDHQQKESNWSKANVIIALIVGIATIAGILWQILKKS